MGATAVMVGVPEGVTAGATGSATAAKGAAETEAAARAATKEVVETEAAARAATKGAAETGAAVTEAEGHPTFPGADRPEEQERALDATIAAMEWPGAEEGEEDTGGGVDAEGVPLPATPRMRVLLTFDPLEQPTTHETLQRLFESLFWCEHVRIV